MELILLQKVTNLGVLGDKVNVKPGYGRNYLVPQGKAVPATAANVAEFEAKRAEYEAKANTQLADAEARKAKLEGATVTIAANASTEGKLFGSVGPRDIAEAFTAAGHKRSTHLFNTPPNGPALPGNEAFGIQWSFDGKFAVFVGGFPIVVNGEVVGGVGLSGGNGEQDTACGLAALQALKDALAASGHEVMVQADIKK